MTDSEHTDCAFLVALRVLHKNNSLLGTAGTRYSNKWSVKYFIL